VGKQTQLFLANLVTRNELQVFIEKIGGVIPPDPTSIQVGRYSNEKRDLWIYLSYHEIYHTLPEHLDMVRLKLGAEPATLILLEMSHEPKTELLVVDFVEKLSQQWKCVAYKYPKVLSSDELLNSSNVIDEFFNDPNFKYFDL
jgi:hypothetical protein